MVVSTYYVVTTYFSIYFPQIGNVYIIKYIAYLAALFFQVMLLSL